ncbi:hypothetical protein CBM2633_B90241 [Cupriavidus taiwanensis]|nr:hypothetical protein CBM2633_B90241 [Cupriavidus taiwanensis]
MTILDAAQLDAWLMRLGIAAPPLADAAVAGRGAGRAPGQHSVRERRPAAAPPGAHRPRCRVRQAGHAPARRLLL